MCSAVKVGHDLPFLSPEFMPIKGKTATEILARRIQQARLRVPGLSQRALGMKMGIPKDTASTRVNRYEQGIHAPDAQTLIDLARTLKVPAGFLLTADDALAEVILGFARLKAEPRKELLKQLRSALGPKQVEQVREILETSVKPPTKKKTIA